jgi:hypothetical protein
MTQTFLTSEGVEKVWPFPDKPAREVQLVALEKGYGKPGFAYFMRQRLGKTLTAFAEFTLLREEGKVDWMMIICPNSLKTQWMEAIEEVDMFIPVKIYESNQKKIIHRFFDSNKRGGVLIINYESVKSFYKSEGWNMFNTLRTYICADESTKIKDFSAGMTKASLEFASVCSYKRVLTGRPKANSNLDMWAQLKFINCTERTHNQHKFTFNVVGGYQGRQVTTNINTDLLQREMQPHCYIAEDKYVQGFEKIYEPIRKFSLAGRQLELYKKMQDDLLFALNDDVDISAPIVLVQYLRLQQISSGIVGDDDSVQHNIIEPWENPKIQDVLEILDTEVANKCIIVCRFRLSIENLYQEITKAGYSCAKFVGGMSQAEITQTKLDFNEGNTGILIAQSQVLSFGHMLAGPDDIPCDTMIFYENTFSLLDRIQCESRPEKYERKKPISYYDFACSKMDRYILDSLLKKEDASLALMNYSRSMGIMPSGTEQLKEIYSARP